MVKYRDWLRGGLNMIVLPEVGECRSSRVAPCLECYIYMDFIDDTG